MTGLILLTWDGVVRDVDLCHDHTNHAESLYQCPPGTEAWLRGVYKPGAFTGQQRKVVMNVTLVSLRF